MYMPGDKKHFLGLKKATVKVCNQRSGTQADRGIKIQGATSGLYACFMSHPNIPIAQMKPLCQTENLIRHLTIMS